MHHRSTQSTEVKSWKPPAEALSFGSLRDYWQLLLRRKWIIGIVFVLVTGIVGAGAMMIPPTFTAQTTIMVKHGREFFYREPGGEAAADSLYSLGEMVNSLVEILSSRDLVEQVVTEMQVERLYPEMVVNAEVKPPHALLAAAVDRFRSRLVVMDVLESSVIRITFQHGDPRVAADALDLLVERFKDKHLQVFGNRKGSFIADQLVEYEGRLGESEQALEEYRQEHGVYDIDEQKSLLLNQLVLLDTALNEADFRVSELEERLQFLSGNPAGETTEPLYVTEDRGSLVDRRGELSSELQQAEMRLAELRQQLVVVRDRTSPVDTAAPMPGFENNRSIDEAFIRLLDLQLREKELLRNYSESSRQVVSVRNEIELVRRFLHERGANIARAVEVTLQDELDSLMARRASALEQMKLVDVSIRSLDVRTVLDELAPLKARRERIMQEIDQLGDEIRALDRYERDFRQLERRVLLDERNYQVFVDTYEDARIMEELDRQKMVNIEVIETAAPPAAPSSLSKKLRLVLGAVVGLFAGLASAVFLELVRHS